MNFLSFSATCVHSTSSIQQQIEAVPSGWVVRQASSRQPVLHHLHPTLGYISEKLHLPALQLVQGNVLPNAKGLPYGTNQIHQEKVDFMRRRDLRETSVWKIWLATGKMTQQRTNPLDTISVALSSSWMAFMRLMEFPVRTSTAPGHWSGLPARTITI